MFPIRVLLLCLWILLGSNARAGIMISIDSISITAGGSSGFVNVLAEWDDPMGSVTIDNFAAQFDIAAPGGATSVLSFKKYTDPGPPSVDHNGDHHFQPAFSTNYLFNGNSLAMDGLPPSHAGSVAGPNDTTFAGGDFRNDVMNDVTLTATQKLLFRLELVATGAATGTELFTLQLASSPISEFYANDGNTTIPFALKAGVQGEISVSGGVAAVPEPATTGALAVLFSSFAIARFRRRRVKGP